VTNRKASERQLNYACVCFVVDDVVKSAEYYRDVLGFSFNRYWGHPKQTFCRGPRGGRNRVIRGRVREPVRTFSV
jgi:catechol 2,3-dioxygenase-like lactoylglutathione lyase family enzyme